MGQNGMIFTTGNIKQQLANANRDYYGRKTWEGMYSSVDLAKKQQENQLGIQYAGAVADAYAQAYNADNAIASSNLGQGYKLAAMEENEAALEQAFNSYRQNYLSGMSEIEESASEANAGIDAALTEQAEYTKQFANKPYEYLQYMYDKYSQGEDADNIFKTDGLWSRYTVTEKDENNEDVTRLMTWDELKNAGARDENGEFIGLFDDQGNLTIRGADFYDFMLNEQAQKGKPGESFGDWLAENDEELYDWANSYNPYNYTERGTNLGSFQTMVGLTSTDQTYSFIERYGGFTKNELDGMYDEFTAKAAEISAKISNSDGYKSKKYISDVNDMVNEIHALTNRLGITEAIESDMGMNFNQLSKEVSNYLSQAKSGGDIWGESLLAAGGDIVFVGTGSYLGMAKAAAVKAGTKLAVKGGLKKATASIPVAGWIISAIITAVSATAVGAGTAKNLKAQNRNLAEASRRQFDNLVTGLVSYSHEQRRQTQSDFYLYR